MNPVALTFHPDGTGSGFYTDLIDLTAIGRLEVKRASAIEFNNQTQRWEVKNMKGKRLFFARTREECIEWEHQHLAERI